MPISLNRKIVVFLDAQSKIENFQENFLRG